MKTRPTNRNLLLKAIYVVLALCLPAATASAQNKPFGVGVVPHAKGMGWVVQEVAPRSIAAHAGIRIGDVVIDGIDGTGRKVNVSVRAGFEAFASLVKSRAFTLVVLRRSDRQQPIRRIQVERPAAGNGNRRDPRMGASRPAGNRAANNRKNKPLILEKKELKDHGSGGMVSHTLLVPKNWKWQGGAVWTPQQGDNFVHFVGSMTAPEGQQVSFGYNQHFAYNDNARILAQYGARMGGKLFGTPLQFAPRRVGEAGYRHVLPSLRPNARNIRVHEAKTNRKAERELAKMMKPLLEMQAQNNRMFQGSGMRINMWFHVERMRVSYTENGQAFEEEVQYTCCGTNNLLNMGQMRMNSGSWYVTDVRTVRAPRGKLEKELPTLISLSRSLRETPRWSTGVTQLRQQIAKIKLDGARRRQQIIADSHKRMSKTLSEISDIQRKGWENRQRSRDKVFKAISNSIRGVEDYKTTTGEVVALDSTYENVYGNGAGNYILTNDHLYNPNTDSRVNNLNWSSLKRVNYFR